jgi:hypothetical protein
MKKLIILLSASLLVVSLSACATSGPASGTKIKCPACGADFNYFPNPEL